MTETTLQDALPESTVQDTTPQSAPSITNLVEENSTTDDIVQHATRWRKFSGGSLIVGVFVTLLSLLSTGLSWMTITATGATVLLVLTTILFSRRESAAKRQQKMSRRELFQQILSYMTSQYHVSDIQLINGLGADEDVTQSSIKLSVKNHQDEQIHVRVALSTAHDALIVQRKGSYKITAREGSQVAEQYGTAQEASQRMIEEYTTAARAQRMKERSADEELEIEDMVDLYKTADGVLNVSASLGIAALFSGFLATIVFFSLIGFGMHPNVLNIFLWTFGIALISGILSMVCGCYHDRVESTIARGMEAKLVKSGVGAPGEFLLNKEKTLPLDGSNKTLKKMVFTREDQHVIGVYRDLKLEYDDMSDTFLK